MRRAESLALQTARRKEIYETLHPETVNGANQHSRVRQIGEPSNRFTTETAKANGRSERAVQRDAKVSPMKDGL